MQIPPSPQPNTLKDNTTKIHPDPYLFPRSHRIHHSDPSPPSLAFLISGSKGDASRLLRLIFTTYHPRNYYLLHLDRFASHSDREKLALSVQSIVIFHATKNVDIVGKANFAYQKGSSAISATLHSATILLRLSRS